MRAGRGLTDIMANSQLIEILLLAMVAGVILFRLYTVLGRRTGHARGLMEIKLADRSFEQEHFLSGARHAYELILTAFSANDRVALKPLLSGDVYAAFDAAMRGREERQEKVSFTFVGFKDSKIVEATLKGKVADIAIAFTSQFISATVDAQEAVVEGDPKSVREVTDIWAFERNVRSSDPNWILVHTSGAEPSA
jgi:predicted lipid-binding transport protein (Tim44 family)